MSKHLPSVFIGSSKEGLDVARAVELQLQDDATTTIWKDGVFGLGSGTLESLMKVLEQFDFAVMVLSPDDLSETRGQSFASPRDNVIFYKGNPSLGIFRTADPATNSPTPKPSRNNRVSTTNHTDRCQEPRHGV